MAGFQKDVFDATQEIDPNQAQKEQEEYARMAGNLQKQFGGMQARGTPTLGIGTPTGYEAATTQSASDEYNRRKAAASNAFDLGSKIDTRRSKLADELDAAIRQRQLATDKYATAQSNTDRENALTTAGIGEDAKQKMQQVDFSLYKSQTDRDMAMKDLYAKGDLEAYMNKAASQNALKQQDIDNYYSMLEAGLRADYEAEMKNIDWDFETLMRKTNRDAANGAAIISGLTNTAQLAMEKGMKTT